MTNFTNKSSFLAGLNYVKDGGLLTVMFTNGKEYKFDSVPFDVYQDFLTSESPGKYFGENIKGKYQAPKDDEE